MKPILLFILCTVICIGCSSTSRFARHNDAPPRLLSTSPYPSLQSRIDYLLSDSLFPPSNVALKVVSPSTGETLYSLNSSLLFNPASNQKLLTAATALEELGEDFLISTVVGLDTTAGIIYVKGCGDPLLSTADLDSIAAMLAGRLEGRKEWAIISDVSYFDDRYWGSGWAWDDEPDPTAMFISPLSVNSNAVKMKLRPGKSAGDSLVITTDQAINYFSIENGGTTVTDSVLQPLDVNRRGKERSNAIRITGQMKVGDSAMSRTLSVWKPEQYTLALLSERLQRYGFDIRDTRIDTMPSGLVEVTHYSHRLDSVVTYMNKVSDNLSAENLLKTLGVEKHGLPGSAVAGASVVKTFLTGVGIDTTKIVIVDGSGVSRYNLLSADALIQLLVAMANNPKHFASFYNSLPIAGEYGSLSNRFRGTTAEHNLRAKTGTLSGASALSGYVRTADGELLAFAMLMQNYPTGVAKYRQIQDRIGILLSELQRGKM